MGEVIREDIGPFDLEYDEALHDFIEKQAEFELGRRSEPPVEPPLTDRKKKEARMTVDFIKGALKSVK